jgi:hypothetical protein
MCWQGSELPYIINSQAAALAFIYIYIYIYVENPLETLHPCHGGTSFCNGFFLQKFFWSSFSALAALTGGDQSWARL